MSDLIDRQALRAAHGLGTDCNDCKRDMKSCQYDRDYSLMDFCEWLDDAPTASPWHRVEEGLPEMSEIVPGYVCSETLVLYDAKSGHIDIGYVREKPDGVDWLWGEPFKNPTHWMPIEPPKEE